jgi:hypothetical protein
MHTRQRKPINKKATPKGTRASSSTSCSAAADNALQSNMLHSSCTAWVAAGVLLPWHLN